MNNDGLIGDYSMVYGSVWARNLQKKTPEMNELDPNKKALKIWAHNSSKQKS